MDSDKIKQFYTNLFNENFQANDQIIAENSQILKTSAKFSSKSVVEHGIDYEDPALLDFLMGSGDREEDERKTMELVRQNFERQINLSKTVGYRCSSSKSPNESGYRSFDNDMAYRKEATSQNSHMTFVPFVRAKLTLTRSD